MNQNQSSQEDNVLKLFHLEKKNIDHFHVLQQADGIHVEVTLCVAEHNCPVCGTVTSKIKDYKRKSITHSAVVGSPCIIDYKARRYLCSACNKTFYEHNPFALPGSKISLFTVYNVLNDLKQSTETFTSVANRHHVSITTATSIFDKHVHMARRQLPEVICVDEVFAFKSEKSKYVCVLLDYESQNIVDLLPSRQKAHLTDYFYKIPLAEREKVKLVSIDMWETYRIVTKLMLPKAKLSVDKFHVMQELSKRLDRVRIESMNQYYVRESIDYKNCSVAELAEYERKKKIYYVYKKFHWLIFSTNDKKLDHNMEKKFNSRLGKYCNFKDLLDIMLNDSPKLAEAYHFNFMLSEFYKSEQSKVESNLNRLIQELRDSNLQIMNEFANTLVRWKGEIINSFIIVGSKNKKINNAIIENRNKTIKNIKHNSNGFTNWDRFRNRVLYVINNDATYSLYPRFEKKGQTDI